MSPPIRSILGLLMLCSGVDIHAQLTVTPQLLSFGDQQVGTQSAPMSVSVRNISNQSVFVAHYAPLDPPFAATSDCVGFPDFFFIAPRGICVIRYTFSPPTEGPYSGNAQVRATGTATLVTFRLTGTGTGVPVIPELVHADGFEAPPDMLRW